MTSTSAFQAALHAHQSGDIAQAAELYMRILCSEPMHADALHLLGVVAYQTRHFHHAVRLILHSIRVERNAPVARRYNNLGAALLDNLRSDLAKEAFKVALILNPAFTDSLINIGNIHTIEDELDNAIRWFGRSITMQPGAAPGHFARSKALLAAGRFQEGWGEYDWRWHTGEASRRSFLQPRWKGEDPSGKTILIHAEQGMGDTIQFCRYVPLVADLGATTIFEAPPELMDLLSGMPGVSQFVQRGDILPAFDYECPLLDLPQIFGTDLKTIPQIVPLPRLLPSPVKRADQGTLRIGICWAGNPRHSKDKARSVPLAELVPLITENAASWHVLQKDLRIGDAALMEGNATLIRDEAAFTRFSRTAELISTLDLVITVDTSIAHLAGTVGVPTWVMLPRDPDWRWLRQRTDSPWYPAMRLFRQRHSGEWQGVIREISSELQSYHTSL